ncbi:hypothetical protein SAMN06273570_0473 [Candidatus Pantoea floridensis]|uniref:Uncharacterized protein n=1 Tax=Candidatus Pantoea floridensis TaxID=1938870 RepID=A0A286BNU2_9GAMM|nr:hypothetical protein BX596_2150 [Enterobacteriaceae bacterium JKS000233]SOD35834.1 hypothetical protein SAMN06273570_0473 [Pantoea floridensis]
MRTLRKSGDIHVGSPLMVTGLRLTDEHYAIHSDSLIFIPAGKWCLYS